MLWGWSVFALFQSLSTWLAYRGRSGDRLRAAVASADRSERRGLSRFALVRWFTGTGSAPSWSVQVSAMALIGVGALLVNSSMRTPVLMASAAVLVVASWVNVWIMFAVQYVRADFTATGFQFPGEGPRSFSDYLYVSLGAQTTFGTTDVSITTTTMRKLSMNHTLVAFAFNSVILAMVVSLILGGVTR
ncbi:MAG: DUF1345 domain-containing protein [Propionibacterium sp.]|nr:DUF1345 domain-containing protein [Propionibacterium sp.]